MTTSSSPMGPTSKTLDSLPTELLRIIARFVTDNTVNTPLPCDGIAYTSSEGIRKQYSSVQCHGFRSIRLCEIGPYDEVLKDSQRDIFSMALVNRRMFTACEDALFRTPVTFSKFQRLLDIFAKRPRLQRYVEHLPVCDEWLGILPSTNNNVNLRRTLDPELLSYSLRSLDIKRPMVRSEENWENSKQWCLLLPKLRSLERLSVSACLFISDDFPYLPNVREAHFRYCKFRSTNLPPPSRTGHLFHKLPSLRILANFHTFQICPTNMLQPFENTLESLSWSCPFREDSRAFATALCRLKNLKHLQTDYLYPMFTNNSHNGYWLDHDTRGLARTVETVEFFPHAWGVMLLNTSHPISKRTRDLETVLRSLEAVCCSVFKGIRVVDLRYVFAGKERGGRPNGYGPDLAEWWGGGYERGSFERGTAKKVRHHFYLQMNGFSQMGEVQKM